MSRFLKAVLAFYVYGNFHIALGAVALSDVTCILLGRHLPLWLAVFIGCATFCLYNLQRVYASWKLNDVERHTTERHGWVDRSRWLMSGLVVVAFIAGTVLFFSHATLRNWWLPLSWPVILAVGYALPLLPWKKRWRRLRDLPAVKVFLVALVWGCVAVIWPLIGVGEQVNLSPEVESNSLPYSLFSVHWFIVVTAYIFAITIPFDIRDFLIDGAQVKSLPVLLGIRRARWLAIAALVPVVALCVYGAVQPFAPIAALVTVAAFCVPTAVVIGLATPRRPEYYFSLLTDGLLLLLWLTVAGVQWLIAL